MINLNEFLNYTKERQSSFENQVAALTARQDNVSKAALYMDIITSNYGERWNNNELIIELDEIFDTLKKKGTKFGGQEISERNSDKYILKYRATVNKVQKQEQEDGTTKKVVTGTKDATKKRKLHRETYEIMTMPKSNAYGIPSLRLYGNYHTGAYAYIASSGTPVHSRNTNSLSVITYTPAAYDTFSKDPVINKKFFDEIKERTQYGLAILSEIRVVDNTALKPAGLIRIDFDLDADNKPIVSEVKLCFNNESLTKGHVSGTNLLSNTMEFISLLLDDYNIRCDVKPSIFVKGGYDKFMEQLDIAQKHSETAYAQAKAHKDMINKKVAEYNEQQERIAQQEAEERAAEKERLKKEREQARIKNEAAKKEKAQAKHDEELQIIITSLKASFEDQGVTPNEQTYQSMIDDITADVDYGNATEEEVALILEALNCLVAEFQ